MSYAPLFLFLTLIVFLLTVMVVLARVPVLKRPSPLFLFEDSDESDVDVDGRALVEKLTGSGNVTYEATVARVWRDERRRIIAILATETRNKRSRWFARRGEHLLRLVVHSRDEPTRDDVERGPVQHDVRLMVGAP